MEKQEQDPQQETDGASENSENRPSLPEKVTLLLSIVVVLVLIGYIAWHGLRAEKGTPILEPSVLLDKAARRAGKWVVPVQIRNRSQLPLEDVQVKVEITIPGGERADIDLSFPYLAERATETALIVTELEPVRAKPKATLESFKQQRDARGY